MQDRIQKKMESLFKAYEGYLQPDDNGAGGGKCKANWP